MNWLKKNWLWLIINLLVALPLLSILFSVKIDFSGEGALFSYSIPQEMLSRIQDSSRPFSQWKMPVHTTGEWAIRFIVITLCCTPINILAGTKKIIRYRKLFGIYTFIYSTAHFIFFLADRNFMAVFSEVNFILGFIAAVIFFVLGVTSNKAAMIRLKKYWKPLQKLTYAAGVLTVLHLALLGKNSWVLYGTIMGIGFILRIPAVRYYFSAQRKSKSELNPEAV